AGARDWSTSEVSSLSSFTIFPAYFRILGEFRGLSGGVRELIASWTPENSVGKVTYVNESEICQPLWITLPADVVADVSYNCHYLAYFVRQETMEVQWFVFLIFVIVVAAVEALESDVNRENRDDVDVDRPPPGPPAGDHVNRLPPGPPAGDHVDRPPPGPPAGDHVDRPLPGPPAGDNVDRLPPGPPAGDNVDRLLPGPPAGDDKGTVILWWTPFTGAGQGQARTCSLGTCFFTEDRTYFQQGRAQAVLFYGSDFSVEDLPLPRQSPRLWWGLLHEESPKNQPLFDHQSVLELFNLTATFRRESNFPLTLQHLESVESLTSRDEFVPTGVKNRLMVEESLAAVAYVQSDCDSPSERDSYVEELAKYIKIDSYGSCLHNRDLPGHLHDPAATYDHPEFRAIMSKYRFTLAIENAACNDYITEKLWRPLTLGSIPIYWGSPSIKDWEPNPGSIILISQFESPKHLAKHLYKLLENQTLYDSHLKHKLDQIITNINLTSSIRQREWGINNDFEKGNFIEHFECYVCDQLIRSAKTKEKELRASLDHYGCPVPPSVSTGQPNSKSFWVEQWHRARVEAKVLNRLIKNNLVFSTDHFYHDVIEELQKDQFFVKLPPEHVEL
ncbi:hypothetical protein OTU49_012522, partial [Cherax quadricarinatus]